MAMGIIISLPLPVDVKTGNRANMVVAVVIKQGRIRFSPASTTDALTASSAGFVPVKGLGQVGGHDHPIICGYPKKGNKSYPNRYT